jgi:hypothetical protein
MNRLLEIFFVPPIAIARLGSADTPVAAYEWTEDREAHSGTETVVRPSVTFAVEPDGRLSASIPDEIRFKEDDGAIRPVAPFFELWVKLQSDRDGSEVEIPCTLDLLRHYGVGPENLTFKVEAGNRKAEMRTGDAACAFIAWLDISGDDHECKPLLASSPHTPDQEPLVFADKPIPLGTFQVIRAVGEKVVPAGGAEEVDLGVIRARFTPGKGKVYGPPTTTTAPASPLPPGGFVPDGSEYGRIWTVVPEKNRVVNPNTSWSKFSMDDPAANPSTPMDSYDGARSGNHLSLGSVDDSCDLIVEAELVVAGERFSAIARAVTGPPDFAPDRRPFYSMADELADRDLGPVEVSEETITVTRAEILDLFRRIFETASLFNLDQHRNWALGGNAGMLGIRAPNEPGWDDELTPKLGPASMRKSDTPYANIMPDLTPGQPDSIASEAGPNDSLPYTQAVAQIHGPLIEDAVLFDVLARRADAIRKLVRPPFAALSDLPERPGIGKSPAYRDPRLLDSQLYDMRMPPYMRHSEGYPLSITKRQYEELMDLLAYLEQMPQTSANA